MRIKWVSEHNMLRLGTHIVLTQSMQRIIVFVPVLLLIA